MRMKVTSITKAATIAKLHEQIEAEKMARKVHFDKFESMKFQRQSRQSQEKRIDYEMKEVLSEEQVNARSYDNRGVPSIVSRPRSP